MTLYTIGHSTHSEAEFTWLLKQHGVGHLIDVRSMPGSRKFPHFNSDDMARWLPEQGIGYRHVADLGGRRNKPKDGRSESDLWWSVTGFRNMSGYVRTPEFRSAYTWLVEFTRHNNAAVCCAEYTFTRCHRRIIADLAAVDGNEVLHIESTGKLRRHEASGWTQQPNFRREVWPGPAGTI